MAAKHSELVSNTELDWIHVDMAGNELAGFSDGNWLIEYVTYRKGCAFLPRPETARPTTNVFPTASKNRWDSE